MRRPRRRAPRHPRPAYGTKLINSRGGSRKWSKITADFVAANPICWLRFPRCTIRATSIDKYYPMKTHPHLVDKPWNWRPACRYCNTARRDTPPHRIPQLRIRLEAEANRSLKQSKALGFFK